VIDDWGRTPQPYADADGAPVYPPAYQQVLKGLPAVNYAARDIIYRPRNVRAHRVYGYSPVQQVLMTVNIALRRQLWQLDYFTEGSIPDALIGVPQGWTPDQIKQFQDYWDTEFSGDLAKRRRAKFVPGDTAAKVVQTKEPEHKQDFDEWLARIICYAFSVPPSAFTSQVNRATAETVQETALAEGLAPLQNWVKQLVDPVIASEFEAPDLEFAWDQDRAVDPSEVAKIAASYVAAGIKSVNEVRAELGLAPVPGGETPHAASGPGGKGQAADASDLANADTLFRSNPNHYGPGECGGQFAPKDEDDASGASPVRPVVIGPMRDTRMARGRSFPSAVHCLID